MCLVNDDGKIMIAHVADEITHEREFLNGRDEDALSVFYMLLQSGSPLWILWQLRKAPILASIGAS